MEHILTRKKIQGGLNTQKFQFRLNYSYICFIEICHGDTFCRLAYMIRMGFHVGDNFKKISWLTYFITYFNEYLVTILHYFNLKAPQIISFKTSYTTKVALSVLLASLLYKMLVCVYKCIAGC